MKEWLEKDGDVERKIKRERTRMKKHIARKNRILTRIKERD